MNSGFWKDHSFSPLRLVVRSLVFETVSFVIALVASHIPNAGVVFYAGFFLGMAGALMSFTLSVIGICRPRPAGSRTWYVICMVIAVLCYVIVVTGVDFGFPEIPS